MRSWLEQFTHLFPLWVLLAGALGLIYPTSLDWLPKAGITIGLALIMLGMGLSLRPADFARVVRSPWPVMLGVALQYTVMPLSGFLLARLFDLPPEFAAGLILVSCCPGGTASNVIAYLARADLGLSVSMTAISTLLAALLTPALTLWLLEEGVPVDALGLFKDTVLVVILPVVVGLLLNQFAARFASWIEPAAPPVAVIAIAMIVGSILAKTADRLLEHGSGLILAVIALHSLGFGLAYLIARTFFRRSAARTISIEVGMQNSGLGAELARSNFGAAGVLVSAPSAVSALTHCIFGSIVAAIWRRDPAQKEEA